MWRRLLNVTNVSSLEIHRASPATGSEHRHASLATDEVLPLVGVRMPVEFANSAGVYCDDGRGNRGRDFERTRINDTNLAALHALCDRLLQGAKGKIMRRRPQRSRCHSLIFHERAWNFGLKDKQFLLRYFLKSLLADAKISRKHVARRMSHPVREKHCRIFRKVTVVEDEQELGAIDRKST